MQTVVERELELNLVLSPERSIAVPARLTYRANDPYAVHITFHLGSDSPVSWTFSRELLIEGVFRPCGHGDVRVWPTKTRQDSVICIALTAPEGNALVEAPASPIATWLEHTLRAVPAGTESRHLRIDEGLDELLGRGNGVRPGDSRAVPDEDRDAGAPGTPDRRENPPGTG